MKVESKVDYRCAVTLKQPLLIHLKKRRLQTLQCHHLNHTGDLTLKPKIMIRASNIMDRKIKEARGYLGGQTRP